MSKDKDASKAAKTLGKLGASKGGQARAQSMTPEQRQEAARRAVAARWAKFRQAAQTTSLTRWQEDVGKRQKTLEALAAISNAPVHDGKFVGSQGPFVVLHFDLMTISRKGDLDRTATYQTIGEHAREHGGIRLSESVYLIPLLGKKSSTEYARDYWGVLSQDLKGRLVFGDIFMLHYVSAVGRMGVISQIVKEDLAINPI